jgi:hypothetical protein
MFSVLNPFPLTYPKFPPTPERRLAANIGYNAASPFSWKEIQLFEKHCRVSGFRYHPLRLSTPTALSFSTKVSNFLRFAFTVAGKDRLILLIIIVNCRLFVHSKRHRTNHQYRICCLFHVFFIYVVLSRGTYTQKLVSD